MTPPRLATWLLARRLRPDDRDEVLGDLAEEFAEHVAARGERAARRWYWRQTIPLAWSLGPRAATADLGGSRLPILEELRFSLGNAAGTMRSLRRQPAFTALVLLTTALGIASTTAVFALVYGIWLKPLPYADVDRLVFLHERTATSVPVPACCISIPDLENYRTGTTAFADIAGFISDAGFATVGGDRVRIVKYRVAPNLFNLLGVKPALGRLFSPPEINYQVAAVILSDAYWRSRFGGDPGVIGQSLSMNSGAYIIVGVMPREFRFPALAESDVWIPLDPHDSDDRASRYYGAIGRLKPGVTLDRAGAELATVSARLSQQYAKTNAGWSAGLSSVADDTFGRFRSGLAALSGLVVLFFCVATVNAASVILTRTATRGIELAVRTALGASHSRLVRQFLLEGLIVGLAGGALGLALGAGSVRVLVALMPANLPRLADVGFNGATFAFAVVLALLTVGWYGFTPAMLLRDAAMPLANGASRGSTRDPNRRWGSGLIIVEIALAVVLLVGSGMMVRSFGSLIGVDHGFQAKGLLTLDVVLPFPRARYAAPEGRSRAFRAFLDRVETIPGVTIASGYTGLPGSRLGLGSITLQAPGSSDVSPFRAIVHGSSPTLFAAMRVPLESGRLFTNDETRVSIVNHSVATRLWPGENPIGRSLILTGASQFLPPGRPFEVVGVAGDTHFTADTFPEVFIPLADAPGWVSGLLMRTEGDPGSLVSEVRKTLKEVEPDVAIEKVAALDDVILTRFALERAQSYLAGFVALLAALLSSVGIYGLLSYSVTRRSRELGIRLALGANSSMLLRLVVRRALALAGLGLVAGVAASLGLVRALRTEVFGLSSPDVAAVIIASVVLLVLVFAAAWAPARRAARTDPLTSIR